MTTPTCAQCPKPLPPLAVAQLDPYCSTECCRIANGCPLPWVASPGHPKKERA